MGERGGREEGRERERERDVHVPFLFQTLTLFIFPKYKLVPRHLAQSLYLSSVVGARVCVCVCVCVSECACVCARTRFNSVPFSLL